MEEDVEASLLLGEPAIVKTEEVVVDEVTLAEQFITQPLKAIAHDVRKFEQPIAVIDTTEGRFGTEISGMGEISLAAYLNNKKRESSSHFAGWFWSFSPFSDESKNTWTQEIYLWMFKWALCFGVGLATMIVCYVLTGTGVFTEHNIYTTNLLQGGVGIHMTTTVGNVPIGYLIGSAWVPFVIMGGLFFLFPLHFFKYVLEGVNMRFDWAFGISWVICTWLTSFVLMAIIGASDVFICLLVSAIFATVVAIMTIVIPYMTYNSYRVIGSALGRKAYILDREGNQTQKLLLPFSVIVSSHKAPRATNEEDEYQIVDSAEMSREYLSYLAAHIFVNEELAHGYRLYGTGKYIPQGTNLGSYRNNITKATHDLTEDIQDVFFPFMMPMMLAGFLLVLSLVEYMAYWVQNENVARGSYPWPVYVVYWIFFIYMLIHYGLHIFFHSSLNSKKDENDRVHLLRISSFWYFTLVNFGNLIVFQLITWFIVAGLWNQGVMYYAP